MQTQSILSTFICGAFGSVAIAALQDMLGTLTVWLMVMFAVVACDLLAGIWKSLKTGVHVSLSRAIRDTMAKLVVYFSFVLMVALLDTATEHDYNIARWACLLVAAIEFGSIISNILKPHGIDLSLKRIIATYISKTPVGLSEEEAEQILTGKEDED